MSQQINLYNAALLPRREWVTGHNLALALGGLMVVLVLMTGFAQFRLASNSDRAKAAEIALNKTRSQLDEVEHALAARQIPTDKDPELRHLQQAVADRTQILEKLEKGSPREGFGFSEYFRGLARQSLGGLWLTGFSLGAGGEGLEIRGRMTDQSLLPEYIRRLNRERAFAGREFAALDVRQPSPEEGASPATGGASAAEKGSTRGATSPGYVDFVLKPLRPAGATVPADKDVKGAAQ